MQDILGESLQKIKRKRMNKTRLVAILLALSLLVSLDVFWTLRQPGLTLAGDADCGITEHTHDDRCQRGGASCRFQEHTHTIECYADKTADVETPLDWQNLFKDYPYTGSLSKDLVGIAKTQVGYAESRLNFEVNQKGVRHGYTRYGAWYGVPYSSWSATFVSFCLHYAGANFEEFPINTGAFSMAEQWKQLGKYAPAVQYTPVCGDLVFFKDNTVGIVAEVQQATIYVIRGDVENAVQGGFVSINDASIAGWGLVNQAISKDVLLDISNGPAIFIVEETTVQTKVRTYSLRSSRSAQNLLAYLETNEGSYFYTLLDKNNQELPKDDQGHYIVIADTGYKLTISFTAPKGFTPGTYQYQVPDGLIVDGGAGDFVLKDGTNVGSWTVTDAGLITLVFNEHINSHTDITISATLGIHFPMQEEPLDFDGKISVVVQKQPEESGDTRLTKWGVQGSDETEGKTDAGKIYWNVNIVGNKDSNIPGSVISDRIVHGEWIGNQSYTQSDMAAGLRFGASDPNWNWYSWTVYPGDPNLTWTETGWSYVMPETIQSWNGEVKLGNEGWIYYIDYSSTPDTTNTPGTLYYMNRVTVDNQYYDGGTNFSHGEVLGEVVKTGTFYTDAESGAFLWELQVTIPGRKEGQKGEYHWYLMDYMYLLNGEGYNAGRVENDAHLAMVTATFNGTTIPVPRVQDATSEDLFAWDNGWSPSQDGITYGREISFLSRCRCNEHNCQFWQTGCGEYWIQKEDGTWTTNGFCQCWTNTENVVFTFVYKTRDISMVSGYGGLGYQLLNIAELYYKPNGGAEGAMVSNAQASVPIPGVFKKELTHDFNGYTANYKVTVNESKLVLTNGTPLTIHDVMTDTLAYISGSLVITAEDVYGNITTLQQGIDYTVTYDGTGNQTDNKGKEVHVLDIVILHPQPVMYVLDYDTTLLFPEHVTSGIKYTNAATITLWGESITDNTVEKVYADINIAAKSYKVEMFKTSALTGEPLGGATFGLFNAQGGLITTAVTDSNGQLVFKTNIVEGIILREHVLYYMQELRAPTGYQLDDTKYWFCFCSETTDTCETCKEVLADTDAIRIPFEQIGKVHATNILMDYDLPETGGSGITLWLHVGVLLISIPLVYKFILRRKRERRRVG